MTDPRALAREGRKTPHPCKGMTKAQIAAFERIAVSEPPRAGVATLQRLLERGLIEKGPDRALGRDSFGIISVPQFYVPHPIHMQWCEWCSEQDEYEVFP